MKKKQGIKHTIKKVTTTKAKANIQSKSKSKTKKSALISPREKRLSEIKKKLLAQKKALLVEAVEALQELPGQITFPDLGDQATAETDRNFMLRLRGRERSLLKKIDNALERIEQGIFGICERCKEEIGIKRLEARPVTTLCIECKTQQEEEEKLMGT